MRQSRFPSPAGRIACEERAGWGDETDPTRLASMDANRPPLEGR